jgi:transposase
MIGRIYKGFRNEPGAIEELIRKIAQNAIQNKISQIEYWLDDGTQSHIYIKSMTTQHMSGYTSVKRNKDTSTVTFIGEPIIIPFENLCMYSFFNEPSLYYRKVT